MQSFQQGPSQNEKGFSLIELLLVVATVGFLVLLLASVPNSIQLIGRSNHQSTAVEIAAKEIEEKRTISYVNLTPGETSINDERINLLPDGVGKTTILDCDSEICSNGENAKQIVVSISWKEFGKDQNVSLHTLIGEGGLNQ